jgi:hypothetical protein
MELRPLVAGRADRLCEYCLISEEDTFFGCAVDHVVSEKHGGPTTAENLAYACVPCNLAKGSDVGSIHWETGDLIRLFNPRTDHWRNHFHLFGSHINGLTPIGQVTSRLLRFNDRERLLERDLLSLVGRYPSIAAANRIYI